MKNLVFTVLLFIGLVSFGQDFSTKVNVVKSIKVTVAERDSWVVPASQIWFATTTDGLKWKNNGGAGWVSDEGGGGGGGTFSGSIAANQIAVGSGANVIGGSSGLTWNGTSLTTSGVRIDPTFANFSGRFATGGLPSFGASRLGDSDTQTNSLDIGQSINFIDGVTPQQVNWSMFENNNVFTLRSAGGDKIGVFDVNGSNQAIEDTDDTEATFAATINYTNGKSYINDMGVQDYTSNGSVVAKTFFHVIQNRGGADELPFWFGRYDGTTYDEIFTVDASEVVDFENIPTHNGDPLLTAGDVVTINGNQTINGTKTFAGSMVTNGGLFLDNDNNSQGAVFFPSNDIAINSGNLQARIFAHEDKLGFKKASQGIGAATGGMLLDNANTVTRTYTFPDKDGTVAMLDDVGGSSVVSSTYGGVSGNGYMERLGLKDNIQTSLWGFVPRGNADKDLIIGQDNDNDLANGVPITYTLNGTGTPVNGTDLIDKAYADANYGGGGADNSLSEQNQTITSLREVILDGANFNIKNVGGDMLRFQNSGSIEFLQPPTIPTEVYGSGWDGDAGAPTKNDIYDKIESIALSGSNNDFFFGNQLVDGQTITSTDFDNGRNMFWYNGTTDIEINLGDVASSGEKLQIWQYGTGKIQVNLADGVNGIDFQTVDNTNPITVTKTFDSSFGYRPIGNWDAYTPVNLPNLFPEFSGTEGFPNATNVNYTSTAGANLVSVSGTPNELGYRNTGSSTFNFVYEELSSELTGEANGDIYRFEGEIMVISGTLARVRPLEIGGSNTSFDANVGDTTNWQPFDISFTLSQVGSGEFRLYFYGDGDFNVRNVKMTKTN